MPQARSQVDRVALVTGVGGQDGYYLTKLLLSHDYEVVGLVHNVTRLGELQNRLPNVSLVPGDITRHSEITAIIDGVQPDEIYNLAGFSFPPDSVAHPHDAFRVNCLGAMNVLEATRHLAQKKRELKFYQASTSEMFGRSQDPPYDEKTAFRPETPYAASKAAAHHLVSSYRTQFNMFAVCGILFNHESSLRPAHYVTRKISLAVARIYLGSTEKLVLGNMKAVRDWGFAGDYVRGMWLMMQRPEPDDYVLATGIPHSVEELVSAAFRVIGINSWQEHVEVSPELVRPTEKNPPIGNPGKASSTIGWKPKISFERLVEMLVTADIERAQQSAKLTS